MSSLSPRLQVRVQQKQILTPGLVQMVSLLQLNKLELKEMISAEIAQNPVLEESAEGGEELSPEELQPLLEAERLAEPGHQAIFHGSGATARGDAPEAGSRRYRTRGAQQSGAGAYRAADRAGIAGDGGPEDRRSVRRN